MLQLVSHRGRCCHTGKRGRQGVDALDLTKDVPRFIRGD